jgi:hypothetical protein
MNEKQPSPKLAAAIVKHQRARVHGTIEDLIAAFHSLQDVRRAEEAEEELVKIRKGCENCPCGHPAEDHFRCGCMTGCPGGCPLC